MPSPTPPSEYGDLYIVPLRTGGALVPTRVKEVSGVKVRQLAAGFTQDAVVSEEGRAMSFAYRYVDEALASASVPTAAQQLAALDEQVAQVRFGPAHVGVISSACDVFTFGNGGSGQLGHGSRASLSEPRLVSQLVGRHVVQLACGEGHTLALTRQGDVYSWGRGFEGQLGLGSVEAATSPHYVSALQASPASAIAAGGKHSAAVVSGGRVYCWGDNYCGQLGVGRKTPVINGRLPSLVTALKDVRIQSIDCGTTHTAALSDDGELYSWGLAAKGQPTSQPFEPELHHSSQRFSKLLCTGDRTVLISTAGEVCLWTEAARPLQTVSDISHLPATSIALSDSALLVLVSSRVLSLAPTAAPIRGGTLLSLRGAGFFNSPIILLRLQHSIGTQRLVSGEYAEVLREGGGGEREGVIIAHAPSFELEGPGSVSVAVSFDGSTFTPEAEARIEYYEEPTAVSLSPDAAPATGGTELLLLADASSPQFVESAYAEAKIVSEAGDVLASATATFVSANTMRVVCPRLEVGDGVLHAHVQLALDGQVPAPAVRCPLTLYPPPVFGTPTPLWVSSEGNAVVRVGVTPFFAASNIVVRLASLLPFDGFEAETESEAEAEPQSEKRGDGGDAATGDAPAAAVDVAEAAPEATMPAVRSSRPVKWLSAGFELEVRGRADPEAGTVAFSMPRIQGVGRLSLELALNGVDFSAVPGEARVYERLALRSVEPVRGPRTGGTQLELRGDGLREAAELGVLFVKGGRRQVVPAKFDPTRRCAVCSTPTWSLDAVAGHAAETEAEADVIVELTLNSQQWTRNCLHYSFFELAVGYIEPALGPVAGGAELKLQGTGFVECAELQVRFTHAVTGAVIHVTPQCTEGTTLTCTTPSFDTKEAFTAQVAVTINGQQYVEAPHAFRYEGAAPKGRKK